MSKNLTPPNAAPADSEKLDGPATTMRRSGQFLQTSTQLGPHTMGTISGPAGHGFYLRLNDETEPSAFEASPAEIDALIAALIASREHLKEVAQ